MRKPEAITGTFPNYRDDWDPEQLKELENATDDEAQEDGSDTEFTQADAKRAAEDEKNEDEEEDSDDDYVQSDDEAAEEDGYDSAASTLKGEAAGKRPPKSPEEVQAEQRLATMLNLSYPDEFKEMRRNLGYLYPCLANNPTDEQAVRMAYKRINFPERCAPDELSEIVREAVRLARDIDMPNEVVQEVFAELSKHNGGRLVTASRRITTLFAIVCMVRQVVKLPEYKRAAVFGNGFSNGEAAVPLGEAYATDTPMDSAMAHGRADVEGRFNAMANKVEVLGLLFGTLANMGDDAAVQAALHSASRSKYDRSRYDETRHRNTRGRMHDNGVVTVALHVVQRQGAPEYTDRGVAALAAQYGSAATPFHTAYPPCNRLREPPPKLTQCKRAKYAAANHAAREADAPRRLVVTHRNETIVRTPDGINMAPGELMKALRGLVEAKGTKLHAHLAQAVPSLEKHGFESAGKEVYLAAYKDGRPVRLGRKKKKARNCGQELWPSGDASCPVGKWLSMDLVHEQEVANATFQPWLAFTPGVWDFYLLVGATPKDDVLVHNKVRQRLREKHIEGTVKVALKQAEDEWRKSKSARPGCRKQKLTSQEKVELDRHLEEKKKLAILSAKSDKEYQSIKEEKALVQFPLGKNQWPLDHPVMESYGSLSFHESRLPAHLVSKRKRDRISARAAAVAQRAVWNKKADEWFRGCAQNAHAAAAHPDNGADVAQARERFAANATAAE